MANKKISALTSATLPLAGTEVLPIVQSSTTNNISVNSLAAGNLKSQSTTGVLQVSGPSAGTTRVMTVPDANFTAARTDAGQTFTGNQQINGLVSLSTSPSAWQSNWSVLEFPGVQNIAVRYGVTWVNQNAYINSGGAWTYGTSSTAAQLQVGAGTLDLNVAVSGTAGNAITWLTGIHVGNTGGVSVGNTTDPGAGNLSVNGNVVPATAAKGINFTANSAAAGKTSQLLNWYEEGTWTPVIVGSTSAGTGTYTTQTGRYTRIGRTVHFTAYIVWTAHTGTGNMYISGLPYASENTANIFFQFSPFSSNLAYTANNQLQLLLFNNATTLNFYQVNGSAAASQVAIDTAADVLVTGTYST